MSKYPADEVGTTPDYMRLNCLGHWCFGNACGLFIAPCMSPLHFRAEIALLGCIDVAVPVTVLIMVRGTRILCTSRPRRSQAASNVYKFMLAILQACILSSLQYESILELSSFSLLVGRPDGL